MKPVRLKFSGLQSYRQEQEIDFTEVGSLGVFGVFGPTGAGKSTILDAITLALYGKVNRATNGTQGIINQEEKKLRVAFEFELGDKKYLAERVLEKNKNNSYGANTKSCRLVCLSDEIVLADKAGNMDEEILKQLGMKLDDFSKAVVLPQGEFDGFLKLTGANRAKMLEHIFNLEQYGDALIERVKAKRWAHQKKLDEINTRRTEMGDCSDNAVQSAEEKVAQIKKEVLKEQEMLQEAEKALEEMKSIKNLYEEAAELTKTLEKLQAQEQAIEAKKEILDLARKVEPLRPLINQAKDFVAREKVIKSDFEVKKQELTNATEYLTGLRAKMTQTRQEYDLQSPLLQEERIKLTDVMEKLIKLREIENGWQDTKKSGVEAQKEIVAFSQKEQDLQKQISGFNQALEILQKQLSQCKTITANRAMIDMAWELWKQVENAQAQEKEAAGRLEIKEKSLHQKEEGLWANLETWDIPRADDLATALKAAEELVEKVRQELNKAETSYDELQNKDKASALAQGLQPGGPCPVCGSLEHPVLAEATEDYQKLLQEAWKVKNEGKEKLEKIQKWHGQVHTDFMVIQQMREEIKNDLHPAWKEKKQILEGTVHKYQASSQGLKGEDLPGKKKDTEEADQKIKDLDEEILRDQRKIQETEALRDKNRLDLGESQKKAEGMEVSLKHLDGQIKELKESIISVTKGEDPQKTLVEVARKLKELTTAKEQVEKEVETYESKERDLSNQVTALESQLSEILRNLEDVKVQLAGKLQQIGLESANQASKGMLDLDKQHNLEQEIKGYENQVYSSKERLENIKNLMKEKEYSQEKYTQLEGLVGELNKKVKELNRAEAVSQQECQRLKENNTRWKEYEKEEVKLTKQKALADRLIKLLKGRKLVEFMAEEHLRDMVIEASRRLGMLTAQRYVLELDEGCGFIMRDDHNGAQRRPVSTLSGGETFLTSLALALALSSKIQLKGQYPLGFFFLDEGFGTLDPEKLELVMNTLEKIHDGHRMVGVITHVPELKNRLPKYLEVVPMKEHGSGSKVVLRSN